MTHSPQVTQTGEGAPHGLQVEEKQTEITFWIPMSKQVEGSCKPFPSFYRGYGIGIFGTSSSRPAKAVGEASWIQRRTANCNAVHHRGKLDESASDDGISTCPPKPSGGRLQTSRLRKKSKEPASIPQINTSCKNTHTHCNTANINKLFMNNKMIT